MQYAKSKLYIKFARGFNKFSKLDTSFFLKNFTKLIYTQLL
jgi:hypothetical protein